MALGESELSKHTLPGVQTVTQTKDAFKKLTRQCNALQFDSEHGRCRVYRGGLMAQSAFSYRATRLMALSFIPFFLLVGLFWGVMAQNIPPFDGAYPTADLARFFVERGPFLRIAYAVAIPSWSFLMLWSLAVFNIMRRVEGGDCILSYTQLVGGSLTTLIPTFASVFWLSAAYRPEETTPGIIRMLYDTGWLMMDLTFAVTTIQYVAMGIVFLNDPRPIPLIPKWLAWLGIWISIEFFAEIIMPHFRSGPFSWSGLFNYWIPFFGPFSLIAIMSVFMMKAITRLEREDAALAG